MNRPTLNKRQFLGLMAAVPLGSLVGCGSSGNEANVRLINASAGYDGLDLYVDDDLTISSVAFGTASSYKAIDEGTVTTALTSADSTTYLLSQSRSLSSGTDYTIIAYGWEGALKSVIASDDADKADSGKTYVSVLNTATDAGSLDIYLTAEDDSLESSTAVASAVSGGSQSSYTEVESATYRLRVTAADDVDDVRLDVSGLVLSSKGVVTLVITPGSSGVLVNALQVAQGGDVTTWMNSQARVRVVAGVSDSARVSATVGDVSVLGTATAPAIGSYVLVDAGTVDVVATVNGTALTAVSTTLEAGADVTVVVHGDSSAPTVTVTTDDNRLPTTSTKLKMRLFNGMTGMDDYPLTLTVDYSSVASSVAAGAMSSFKALTASSSSTVEVTSSASATALLSLTETTLTAQSVYTVFMFGTQDAPSGALRKER